VETRGPSFRRGRNSRCVDDLDSFSTIRSNAHTCTRTRARAHTQCRLRGHSIGERADERGKADARRLAFSPDDRERARAKREIYYNCPLANVIGSISGSIRRLNFGCERINAAAACFLGERCARSRLAANEAASRSELSLSSFGRHHRPARVRVRAHDQILGRAIKQTDCRPAPRAEGAPKGPVSSGGGGSIA